MQAPLKILPIKEFSLDINQTLTVVYDKDDPFWLLSLENGANGVSIVSNSCMQCMHINFLVH